MLPDGTYSADKVFTGDVWEYGCVIVVRDSLVVELLPDHDLPQQHAHKHFGCIVPAFIDIQIYGAGGKLFSEFPEADTLHKIQKYCSDGNTDNFVVAVATNTTEIFHQCIDAVREYWYSCGTGCIGLHLEGPWISSIKRGAHTLENVKEHPTTDEVKALLDYGKGVIKIITLAPEVCSTEVIALIKSYGVILSAGHSNTTYETAMDCFDSGLVTTVTHLYNAMSGLTHRAPGLVGAVLNHPTIRSSIIADGYHVDFAAVEIAKKIMGPRLFLITDAVTETSSGIYPHERSADGEKYESNGILSGSALTMEKAVRGIVANCVSIPIEEALRMGSLYPAEVMGLSHEFGRIAVGYKAAIVEWSE